MQKTLGNIHWVAIPETGCVPSNANTNIPGMLILDLEAICLILHDLEPGSVKNVCVTEELYPTVASSSP